MGIRGIIHDTKYEDTLVLFDIPGTEEIAELKRKRGFKTGSICGMSFALFKYNGDDGLAEEFDVPPSYVVQGVFEGPDQHIDNKTPPRKLNGLLACAAYPAIGPSSSYKDELRELIKAMFPD